MGGALAHHPLGLAFDGALGNILRMGMGRYGRSPVAFGAMLALLMAAGASAKPKEPLRLAPSSKWVLNYAADSCRMAREFGEGDRKVQLVIDRYEPGDAMRISFYGKPARTSRTEGEAKIRFGPTEAVQDIGFYPGKGDGTTPALVLRTAVRIAARTDAEEAANEAARNAGIFDFDEPTITPEQEAAVMWIEVGFPVDPPFVLDTGSMGNVFAALRQCTDELLDHWGIDIAKHRTMTRRAIPKGNPGKWVRPEDYPREALLQGQRGLVHVRLDVDAAGQPTGCHIQQSTRPREFDDAVCKSLMRRAEFQPALDADAVPMASYWINTVNFHM